MEVRKKIIFNTYMISINNKDIKVCVPVEKTDKSYICTDYINVIYSDAKELEKLLLYTSFMHHNKDCLIYCPIYHSKSDKIHQGDGSELYKSLVLMHHTIQLKTKKWKEIRHRLKYLKPIKEIFRIPNNMGFYKTLSDELSGKQYYREFKDKLGSEEKFNTLFLTGSQISFGGMAGCIVDLIEETKDYEDELEWYGIPHVHLDWLLRDRNQELCIDFYDERYWN